MNLTDFPTTALEFEGRFSAEPTSPGPLGLTLLGASGVRILGVLPLGVTGLTLLVQGAVLATARFLGNPAFTLTNPLLRQG